MVVSLGPGKFYGTSLPRPRIYTDVKFNDHRIDPPLPVNDPLMSWAEEAHWSMGGLSFKRLRLQGKIEGNVQRLRDQRQKAQAHTQSPTPPRGSKRPSSPSPSPPPAPVITKRRKVMDLIPEEEEEEIEPPRSAVRKSRLVKKLGDDFDRVALESDASQTAPLKPRTRRLVKSGEPVKKMLLQETAKSKNPQEKKSTSEAETSPRVRASPRLAKRVSN